MVDARRCTLFLVSFGGSDDIHETRDIDSHDWMSHDVTSCFANIKDIISASQHRLEFWWPQIPVLPSSLTSPHKYKVSNNLGFERI